MKPFEEYQYLEGEPMTERDIKERGSKFWNEGKWSNFVLPFLPEDCGGMTLIDMGCNAGLFLKLAQDKGFGRIIGVDSNKGAVEKGLSWRDKDGGTYQILHLAMEKSIDVLPVADYTVLANVHYYFTINDWLDYLDKLQYKTRYCIIVTAEKHHINRCWALADLVSIKNYFKNWDEAGFIDQLPLEGDPMPRRLWGLCFKSRFVDKVPTEVLDSSNHVQDEFYGELDKGTEYKNTRYYRILQKYRRKWGVERLDNWMLERIKVYDDLKRDGLKKPILVDANNRILDGNHRYSMMKNLGYKQIFIRRT